MVSRNIKPGRVKLGRSSKENKSAGNAQPGHISLYCSQNDSSKHFDRFDKQPQTDYASLVSNLRKRHNKLGKSNPKKPKKPRANQNTAAKADQSQPSIALSRFFVKKKIHPKNRPARLSKLRKKRVKQVQASRGIPTENKRSVDLETNPLRVISPKTIGNFRETAKFLNVNSLANLQAGGHGQNPRSGKLPDVRSTSSLSQVKKSEPKLPRRPRIKDFKSTFINKYKQRRRQLIAENIYRDTSYRSRSCLQTESGDKPSKPTGLLRRKFGNSRAHLLKAIQRQPRMVSEALAPVSKPSKKTVRDKLRRAFEHSITDQIFSNISNSHLHAGTGAVGQADCSAKRNCQSLKSKMHRGLESNMNISSLNIIPGMGKKPSISFSKHYLGPAQARSETNVKN